MADIHGHPKKVFLVVMGLVIFVSLSHMAMTLGVDIGKASIHAQLAKVGAPTTLCDATTLKDAKEAGMMPLNSRAFRIVPLRYMLKVVDAYPKHWGFLKAPLQLLSATTPSHQSETPSHQGVGMPTIPTSHSRRGGPQATLTPSHFPSNGVSSCLPFAKLIYSLALLEVFWCSHTCVWVPHHHH